MRAVGQDAHRTGLLVDCAEPAPRSVVSWLELDHPGTQDLPERKPPERGLLVLPDGFPAPRKKPAK